MFKKTICVLLAALMIFALCACANRPGQTKADPTANTDAKATEAGAPTSAQEPERPDYTDVPAAADELFADLDDATVVIRFTGEAEAEVTIGQIKALSLRQYSESADDDTPVFSGPSMADVLGIIGGNKADTITISFGNAASNLVFNLADIDLSSALFAVFKDGKLMGENKSTLICSTSDGFEYVTEIEEPIILG